MNSLKITSLVVLLALSACEAARMDVVTRAAPTTDAKSDNKPTATAESCHNLVIPLKAGQSAQGDSTLWKCTGNTCSSLPFNTLRFYQVFPIGAAPVGQSRVDVIDDSISGITTVGCYPLGAGDPLVVNGGDLPLTTSRYSCAQRMGAQNYPTTLNCNTLSIGGIDFEYVETSPGY